MTHESLLSVENLTTVFDAPSGPLPAVDGVDLAVARGEIVAVVGEIGRASCRERV